MAASVRAPPQIEGDKGLPVISKSSNNLLEKLASVLPKGHRFGVYHLSTPPTRTDPLYSAPPGERPDKTYWENHFLAVSIDVPTDGTVGTKRPSPGIDEAKDSGKKVFIFALEIFLFTTAYATTLFVSKADSTGYLELLGLPKGTPSPIREVTTAFFSHLLDHRQRAGVPFVVSLFARAQDQYLFPLSVENPGKHVLDDRGLVKWWCRVLDPMLEKQHGEDWASVKGYLVVPGLEQNETRFFLPRASAVGTHWVLGHPMEKISHYTEEFDWVPPRCLIPRYPDDPKSRFRDELDDESLQSTEATGRWNSVRSLDQFWEMMAFRQECSSGRLTGFIWVVFDPIRVEQPTQQASGSASLSSVREPITPDVSFSSACPPVTPPRRRASILASSPLKLNLTPGTATSSPSKLTTADAQEAKPTRNKRLTGPIVPRLPRVKRKLDFSKIPTSTPFYYWPTEGRGEAVVKTSDYKRIVEMLLHLNFKSLPQAISSTVRWIGQVVADGNWGQEIVGARAMPETAAAKNSATGLVTDLNGLIRKKAKSGGTEDGSASVTTAPSASVSKAAVTVLGAGLVRKKAKPEREPVSTSEADSTGVNLLGPGLIRKKPKAG